MAAGSSAATSCAAFLKPHLHVPKAPARSMRKALHAPPPPPGTVVSAATFGCAGRAAVFAAASCAATTSRAPAAAFAMLFSPRHSSGLLPPALGVAEAGPRGARLLFRRTLLRRRMEGRRAGAGSGFGRSHRVASVSGL